MKSCVIAVFLLTTICQAADDESARLRKVSKAIENGDLEILTELNGIHSEKAARLVFDAISNRKVESEIKSRLAEIVADWPQTAPGRKTLIERGAKNPNCSDEELLFISEIGLPELRSVLWSQIEIPKGKSSKSRQPHRVGMAIRGLGHFEDNPESVVTHIAGLLVEDEFHLIRSSAAEALGGMRNRKAVPALIQHIEDESIGFLVARSLYRLTGMYFDQDPAQQWADWLVSAGDQFEIKALTVDDFDGFLKMQRLVKPDDDPVMNMNTFYGLDIRGKGLLFILDVSGSMSASSRIEKLRTQMENILIVLESRSEKTRFDIVTFGATVDSCFRRGVMSNTVESRKVASRFIKGLNADGGTPMIEALTYAQEKILPEGNIDTIFFLSDGAPGDGTPEMVLELTRQIHQRYRIRFNTVSIGERLPGALGEATLLQKMATLTEGIFTETDEKNR